jgi:transglutaminase-like putative cysteine protease
LKYQISHMTHYAFSQPVHLAPHTLRLCPRSDAAQHLQSFQYQILPMPTGLSPLVDLDGNACLQVWFTEITEHLQVQTTATVVTRRSNPFDFVLFPWATRLPLDYPQSWFQQLQPYLHATLDSSILSFAQELLLKANHDTLTFLTELNQEIYHTCSYVLRESGDPWPAGLTWKRQQGSCRDLAVLFMECCRAIGLAARFVSGYQAPPQDGERDPSSAEELHLHAWAEVYLPGGGWRGYDPTQGLAVADSYIALASSPWPAWTAPVSGHFRGSGAETTLQYQLQIMPVDH